MVVIACCVYFTASRASLHNKGCSCTPACPRVGASRVGARALSLIAHVIDWYFGCCNCFRVLIEECDLACWSQHEQMRGQPHKPQGGYVCELHDMLEPLVVYSVHPSTPFFASSVAVSSRKSPWPVAVRIWWHMPQVFLQYEAATERMAMSLHILPPAFIVAQVALRGRERLNA